MREQFIAVVLGQDDQGRLRVRLLTSMTAYYLGDPPEPSVNAGAKLSEEEYVLHSTLGGFDIARRGRPLHPEFLDKPLPPFEPGDIIQASYATGHPDEKGDMVVVVQADVRKVARIEGSLNEEGLAQRIKKEVEQFVDENTHLIKDSDLYLGYASESAKREKNEAFFLATRDDRGGLFINVFHHTGSYFFWEEWMGDVACSLEGMVEEPGLWLLTDGHAHYGTCPETGYIDSSDIDGHVKRVTLDEGCAHFDIERDLVIDDLIDIHQDCFSDEEAEAYVQRNFVEAGVDRNIEELPYFRSGPAIN